MAAQHRRNDSGKSDHRRRKQADQPDEIKAGGSFSRNAHATKREGDQRRHYAKAVRRRSCYRKAAHVPDAHRSPERKRRIGDHRQQRGNGARLHGRPFGQADRGKRAWKKTEQGRREAGKQHQRQPGGVDPRIVRMVPAKTAGEAPEPGKGRRDLRYHRIELERICRHEPPSAAPQIKASRDRLSMDDIHNNVGCYLVPATRALL